MCIKHGFVFKMYNSFNKYIYMQEVVEIGRGNYYNNIYGIWFSDI